MHNLFRRGKIPGPWNLEPTRSMEHGAWLKQRSELWSESWFILCWSGAYHGLSMVCPVHNWAYHPLCDILSETDLYPSRKKKKSRRVPHGQRSYWACVSTLIIPSAADHCTWPYEIFGFTKTWKDFGPWHKCPPEHPLAGINLTGDNRIYPD